MTRKKVVIALVVVVVLAGMVYANFAFKRTPGVEVNVEKIELRDLEAIVSSSGKIQPKKSVQISAETSGKVVNLEVNEGDMVKVGQPLLQIDPRNLETQVQNREASISTARSTLEQTRTSVENARLTLKQVQDTLARAEAQNKSGLISREQYERAVNDEKIAASNLRNAEQNVKTQEERIKMEQTNLDDAKYNLNKVRIVSPINGLVTKRNIEEGETAMIGTMNNAGSVLLTIADLSIIQAEVEVDETDIPFITKGEKAKVTIDALPDKTFPGTVTEVGNSPIVGAGATTTRATNFKVVVTIDGLVPGVRPGFTCTAVITTATRQKVDRRADSGHDRARDGARREGERRPRGDPGPRARPRRRSPGVTEHRAEARPDAQGNRGRLHGEQWTRALRADQDRHRGREIFRGPDRAQGRRRSHRRARSPRSGV